MEKKLIAIILVVVTLVGLGGAYFYVQSLAQAYRGVEFQIKDAEIALMEDSAELSLTASLSNPSSKDLIIPSLDLDLSINEDHIGYGTLGDTHLPTRRTETSQLTLTFSYSDLASDVVEYIVDHLRADRTVELEVEGVAHIGLFFITVDLPFYKKVEIPIFEMPTVKAITHSWGLVSEEKIEVESEVTLENPNPLAISLGKTFGVEFTVAINDIPLVQGTKTGVELEKGDFTIHLTTEFDMTKVQKWWVSHLQNGERSEVSIEAEVFLETGSSRVVLLHKGPITREIASDIPSKIKLKEPKDVPENLELFYVTIKDVSSNWGEMDYEHTNINSIATIHNPNKVSIPVPRFSYRIKFNDIIVGEGTTSSATILAGNTDTQLLLTTTIDNDKLDDWIVSHIQNDESSNLWIEITPEIRFGGKTYTFNLLSKTVSKVIITDLLNQGLTHFPPALDISLESPANNTTVYSSPVTLRALVTSDGTPVEGAEVKFYVSGTEIGSDTTDSSGIASINYALTASTLQYTWYVTAEKEGYDSVTSSTLSFTYSPGTTQNASIQIIISPKPAYVDQEVVIKTVDSNLNLIEGVKIVYIKSIHAVIEKNIITNGKYIGETNSDGELLYTFTSPEVYVIGATKILEYYPAIEYLTVKPPPPDFTLFANVTEITIPRGGSGMVSITVESLNSFDSPISLICPSPSPRINISIDPEEVTPPADGSITSTMSIGVEENAIISSRSLEVIGISGILPERICIIILHIEGKPMTVKLLTPLDGTIASSSEVELRAEVTSGRLPISGATVKFYIDNTYVDQSTTGAVGYTSYTHTFSEGSHTWYVTAEKEGYESGTSPTRTIIYTPSELTVSLVNPSDGEKITPSPVSLEVWVRDGLKPVQDATVTFYVNGEQVGSDSTNRLGHAIYNYPISREGSYHWCVEVEKEDYETIISSEWGFTHELPEFDFSISVSPSSRTVKKGDSTTYTVTVTLLSGSPETVWLTVTGLPSATKSFSISFGTPTFTSTLTVDTSIATGKGTHELTIRGVNLGERIIKEAKIEINVT